eukprot:15348762-Ditylum_brightwellii.AAC.1
MALRRPPTRIELKPDDIEEYDECFSTLNVAFHVLPSPPVSAFLSPSAFLLSFSNMPGRV